MSLCPPHISAPILPTLMLLGVFWGATQRIPSSAWPSAVTEMHLPRVSDKSAVGGTGPGHRAGRKPGAQEVELLPREAATGSLCLAGMRAGSTQPGHALLWVSGRSSMGCSLGDAAPSTGSQQGGHVALQVVGASAAPLPLGPASCLHLSCLGGGLCPKRSRSGCD